MQGGPAGVDETVPGPVPWQSQVLSSAGVDDAPGDGQDAEAEPLGLAPSGGFFFVEGQGLGRCEEVGCDGDDLEPDLVLGVAVEGQVPQAGVFEVADAAFASGALPVSDLQVSQPPVGTLRVGGEAGDLSRVDRSAFHTLGEDSRANDGLPVGRVCLDDHLTIVVVELLHLRDGFIRVLGVG